MNNYTTNGYDIEYYVTVHGGINILSVTKGKRDITKEMDVNLRVRLIDEIAQFEQDEKEAHEWEAMQDYLDEVRGMKINLK